MAGRFALEVDDDDDGVPPPGPDGRPPGIGAAAVFGRDCGSRFVRPGGGGGRGGGGLQSRGGVRFGIESVWAAQWTVQQVWMLIR